MFRIDLSDDPLEQFKRWYEEAKQKSGPNVDAMTLATADKAGRPSARIVLYKDISRGGFVFYTNYHSRKGIQISANPYAALVFYWPGIEKQVRVEGMLKQLAREESEAYFETRPYESKLSAWVSEQSQEIPDREHLTARYKKYRDLFSENEDVRCPEYWGGYRLNPDRMEFWIGREHRLHDRFVYVKKNDHWDIIRLAP